MALSRLTKRTVYCHTPLADAPAVMAWEGRHYSQSFHLAWVNYEGHCSLAGPLDHFLYLRWPTIEADDYQAEGTYHNIFLQGA
eukprot:2136116-Rhodomonas_salina.1